MFRFMFSASLVVAVFSSLLFAAPPKKENWVDVLTRYTGTFHMLNAKTKKPMGEFTSAFTEDKGIFSYSFKSLKGSPDARMTGFAFWNKKEKRPEFNEIEFSKGGRVAANGFCIDWGKDTCTWIVSFWNQEGMIRQISMVDTFQENGDIKRVVNLINGDPLDDSWSNWKKIK